MTASLHLEGKVHHHDGVLLHDADEQDDSDHCHNGKLEPRDLKSQQGAQPGAGECGEDRNRMDQALVEHAEDNINGEQRGQDEDRLIGDRLLKDLSVTGKTSAYSCGHVQFRAPLLNDLRSALERYTRHKIKRNRHRRELALMVHCERDVGNL